MTQALRAWSSPGGAVYGPIETRRFGRSLGINVGPAAGKLCNFDCVYCQLGGTPPGPVGVQAATHRLFSAPAIAECVERALDRVGRDIDWVTFSGNGEPTLHPHFDRLLDDVLALRDRRAPEARVAVLSNGSALDDPRVGAALDRADAAVMKLDAGTTAEIEALNRPRFRFDLDDYVRRLRGLRAPWIQALFVMGRIDTTTPPSVLPWIERVAEIRPARVQITTIDRSTAEPGIEPAPEEALDAIAATLAGRFSNPIDVYPCRDDAEIRNPKSEIRSQSQ